MVRIAAVVGVAVVLAAGGGRGTPANAAGETISGSGSTWSANAVNQWISDVRAQGTNVNFSANGSGAGRKEFADKLNDFANSDIPYQIKDPLTAAPDTAQGRKYAYIPIIAGGTSLMYHLQAGNNMIRNVRLSDDTVAKIFTGNITMWNDPQITADMNGHALPAKKIQVVVDSQGGGTTAQFTDWLVHRHGDLWQRYAGSNVPTSYYPIKGDNMSGAPGDDRISATIASPQYDGAIGFVQYSYALNLNYPVAKVKNAAGYYTAPTPYNVAVALTKAYVETTNHDPAVYLTQQLKDVYTNPDPRTYALSSYSYMIMPTDPNDARINEGKAQTFANFSYYALCDGQGKAPQLGYSPLPLNLVQAAFAQVPQFPHMKAGFQSGKDPSTCNNPTFDKAHPDRNHLAEIDPAPQACDQQGQGPCGTDNNADPFAPGAGGPGAAKGGTGSASNGSAAGAGAAADAGLGDPATGGDPGTGNGASAAGTSTELAAFRSGGMTTVMGVLAAIELVLCLLVPAFVGRAITRRIRRDGGG
jgi:phosphate ABC transporter phosphate-binding protein